MSKSLELKLRRILNGLMILEATIENMIATLTEKEEEDG